MALHPDCEVYVKATMFDEDEDNRWSEGQFGDEWETATVLGEVQKIRNGRVRVWFPLDKTSYNFDPKHLTHDPTTCTGCAARLLAEIPGGDGEGKLSIELHSSVRPTLLRC